MLAHLILDCFYGYFDGCYGYLLWDAPLGTNGRFSYIDLTVACVACVRWIRAPGGILPPGLVSCA